MPRYFYKAKNLKGQEESGALEASNKEHLAGILRKKGYFLVSAEGGDESIKEKPRRFKISSWRFSLAVPLSEKLFFTRNMEVMIKTGVPLPRAFKILAKQTKSQKFKQALEKVSESIIKGKTISDAMAQFPKIFPELYRETLKVGEETGKLDESFRNLEGQMSREHRLKSQIKTAMVYPAVILCMAFLIGILMMVFAVPKLKEAFEDLAVELPLTTKTVLGFADFLSHRWYLALLMAGIAVFLGMVASRSERGGRVKSYVFLKIPIMAKIVRQTNIALTLRTLGSLLRAGVPIVRALEVSSGALTNSYFRQSLLKAAKIVKKGGKISAALEPYQNLYSSMVIQMMEVGEETGETPDVLGKLADFYEEEVATATKKLSSVIEPVLILFIGAIVGLFAISMMQPMFSIMSGI